MGVLLGTDRDVGRLPLVSVFSKEEIRLADSGAAERSSERGDDRSASSRAAADRWRPYCCRSCKIERI